MAFQALMEKAVEQRSTVVAERWRRIRIYLEVVTRTCVLLNTCTYMDDIIVAGGTDNGTKCMLAKVYFFGF